MDSDFRVSAVFAWMFLGVVVGFVVYSLFELFGFGGNGLLLAAGSGGLCSIVTILLMHEQESNRDKFFVALCCIFVAALALFVNNFGSVVPKEYTFSAMLFGILMGILISLGLVAYIIRE